MSAGTQAPRVVVVGGGPAGLMAAEAAAAAGARVTVYEAMPSFGRKFLMAGRGGLNLTHAEPAAAFRRRYQGGGAWLERALDDFDAGALRAWVEALGVRTFVGSSGRVFPVAMKASPLLRAWLQRLDAAGVRLRPRHRLAALAADADADADAGAEAGKRRWRLRLAAPDGDVEVLADAVVLALGGGSWPRLGSDGAWMAWLGAAGVAIEPLRAANSGFEAHWSAHLRERFAGHALKNVRGWVARADGGDASAVASGECVITRYGLEGGLVYALSAPLRTALARDGEAVLWLNLLPDVAVERVHAALAAPRAGRTLARVLARALKLDDAKRALLHECVDAGALREPARLAAALKALPVRLHATRPIAEAISSAGGVADAALDEDAMLRQMPGVFCAGEMLDWDAPTGGYLLTAAFALGRRAGAAAARWARPSE